MKEVGVRKSNDGLFLSIEQEKGQQMPDQTSGNAKDHILSK